MGCSPSQGHGSLDRGEKKRAFQIMERNMKNKNKQPRYYYSVTYDYRAENEGDLDVDAGDRLLYIDVGNDEEGVICLNLRTRKKGYVPLTHVQRDVSDSDIKDNDWWFDGNREEAEMILIENFNASATGIFLVRQSSDNTNYVLSVRTADEGDRPCVTHCRVYGSVNEGFVFKQYHFRSLPELIQYFKEDPILGVLLTKSYSQAKPVPKLKDIQVRRTDIRIGRMLGAGYFGEVWEGELHNHTPVAVKVLKEGSMTKDSFLGEAKIMNKLRHRRLVHLLAVCIQRDQTLIVMEYMPNGPLPGYLKDRSNSFRDYVFMALQISEGMKFLEAQNFIHRDLRAANILVGEEGDVKVADFGLARVLSNTQIYTVSQSTPLPVKWTAPEGIKSQNFSSKSDVWSFGIVLYEIITNGQDPYPGLTGPEVVREVMSGYQMPRPRVPQDVGDTFYPIMVACWNFKPNRRPTFGTIHQQLYHVKSVLFQMNNEHGTNIMFGSEGLRVPRITLLAHGTVK